MLIQKLNKNINTVEYIAVYKTKSLYKKTKQKLITRVMMNSSLLTILSVKSNSDHSIGIEQRRDVRLA